MTFENSNEYNIALKQYKERTYKDLLNPESVIIDGDTVLLFYKCSRKELEGYLEQLVHFFKCDEYDDTHHFPKHLGYEEPKIINYEFMGQYFNSIRLWFDGEVELAKRNWGK